MAHAHLAECAALEENMQALLKNVVAARSNSTLALSRLVEQRVEKVRTAVLAEVAALKRRPGGLSGLSSRFGTIDGDLQEQLEHHDAFMTLSHNRLLSAVQYKFDQVPIGVFLS